MPSARRLPYGLGLRAGIGGPVTCSIGYPSIVTDGTCSLRQVIRDDYLCTDITLTATGFDGTEDVDWENLSKSSCGWSS